MNSPSISVIIPVYNGAEFLWAALKSIVDQRGEIRFEIIIVLDGCTDESPELIKRFQEQHTYLKITSISMERGGVSAARNAGLKVASGDFIAFLDADDEWLPDKTTRQMDILKDLNIDLIACLRNGEKLLPPYRKVEKGLAKITFKKLLIRNTIPLPSVIFKRKLLENTGFFQEGQNYAEDHDYWLRATVDNKLYILNESLVITGNGKKSFGESGLSADLWSMFKGFVQNLKRVQIAGRISKLELYLYMTFYFCKYLLLVVRTILRKQRHKS